ncbi:RagB/SusD family nutrient uptake outer membrane protein [Pontimicrobium aquaticum]|uniref:RagB/SusD family nutrient uptake outer membrane protein n=1 Tax=Pontimicrobium aquaticum TaxID=2565367 RepID=A0A4U0F010_9FLAO|nr:RagB/SusD family nutrient uptake outer membrane protein [Pontimicrobium aquaticum]TJY37054.1 RagB/SusD family nutrient uptake outer membrane protein [Pontimicrobium aquaticum]
MKKVYILFTTLAFIGLISCNTEDLEPSLEQNKSVEGSITSVEDLYGIIKGAYNEMTASGYYGRDFIINNEVRTDNCFSNGNSGRFTTEASFAYTPNTGFMFDDAYQAIAAANIIIGTDVASLEGDTDYGLHIQGQAYAVRALAHFDVLKQYGQQHVGGTLGIPYVKEFKGDNLFPARNTISENKADIYADLETAFSLMDDNYFDSSKEFMSKYTAKALESRVATYFGDWPRVVDAAEEVINSNLYSIMSAANYVGSWASKGNNNSIFELAFNTSDNLNISSLGNIYRTTGGGSYGDIQVIDGVDAIFEPGDVRGGILGYEGVMLRNIGKFPSNQGYDNVVIIRYEEVILNYAEALFETGGDALTQLNLITSNRGATPYLTATKENILNERRKELMFEGHRFDDLVRTGQDIEKTSLQQNFASTIPYGDHRLAWPIPQAEIDANSNMEQNPGYGN